MTKVSEDRDLLKKYAFDQDMKKFSDNQFSYIDTFLKYRPRTEESGIKKKIRNLSTLNILYSVYLSYKKIDRSFIKKLDRIRFELSTRVDLFPSVIDFLENNEIIYDDLYFWHPGLKYSDIFSLIIDLLPNIVNDYKKYLTRQLIIGSEPKTGILEIFKKRLSKNLGDFDVIKKDLVLFNVYQDLYFNTEYEEISSIGKKRKGINKDRNKRKVASRQVFYKIVTSFYWKDNDDDEEICKDVFNMLDCVDVVKDYNEDIELVLCPSLTYLEIEIKGYTMVVEMTVLNDLLCQNERSKLFWITKGVINEDWEFL